MTFLLYGANGFTGKLIAEAASRYGLTPILAGRSEEKIQPLADELEMEYAVFSLSDARGINRALQEVPLVLHAAGPFEKTARPMMEGCLRTKTHYLDITGEIGVFEMAHNLDGRAKEAGVMLLPGVGFDVVPTDCMALHLKKRMPEATHLQLAFSALGGGLSHGTAMTMAESLGESGAVRRDGRIVDVPVGHKTRWVPFPEKERFCMTIPWGDVSTAFRTTGIPNIETYVAVPPSTYKYVRLQRYFGWLLRTSLVRNFIKKQIAKRPAGPSPEQRSNSRSLIWGAVRNNAGRELQSRMTTMEGYSLTVETSLLIAKKVLEGSLRPGFQTPAGMYGKDLILEIDSTKREDLE